MFCGFNPEEIKCNAYELNNRVSSSLLCYNETTNFSIIIFLCVHNSPVELFTLFSSLLFVCLISHPFAVSCLSRPFYSIFTSSLLSSSALCLFPGTDYAPPLTSLETPSVPVSWNICPVTSCREKMLSLPTPWWWKRWTRSRTGSSARRMNMRMRGALRVRPKCRRCGCFWSSNDTVALHVTPVSAKSLSNLKHSSKKISEFKWFYS